MSFPDRKSSFPIKVYARQRPFTKAEIERRCASLVHRISPRELILKTGFNERRYMLDYVFGGEVTQIEVYNFVVAPLIHNVVAGHNCTVFAHGQTGTGKTHTIFGEISGGPSFDFQTDTSVGLISRASQHLFSQLSRLSIKTEYTVQVSFFEIYNEAVRDLLNNKTPLRVYDDPSNKGSVYMKDLTKVTVANTQDVYDWLKIGLNECQNASTNLNLQSSRSHTLFIFVVNVRDVTSKGDEIIKTGRLCFVDLAGSENVARSGAVDVRAREAGTVNRSLISLSKVIKALAQKLQHIPYRDSKLTRILQDSLGGTAKTAMIATFSPNAHFWDETNLTLELAHLARSIVNHPQVNVNRKQANLLDELNAEISKLKAELFAARQGEGFYVSSETFQRMTHEEDANNKQIVELLKQIKDLDEHTRLLEQQKDKLGQSFAKTKKYLEERQSVLLNVCEALKRGQQKLEEMNTIHQTVSAAASTLRKACENSTRNEEIYYRKYQNKCVDNSTNARAVRGMASATLHCIDTVRNASQDHRHQTVSQAENIRRFNSFLQNNHLRDLRIMTELSDEIHVRTERYRIQMEHVLRNNTDQYCVQNIQRFVSQMYDQSLNHLRSHLLGVCLLDKLKKDVAAKIQELRSRSERLYVTCRDEMGQTEVYCTKSADVAVTIRQLLDERQKQIYGQLRRDEARAAAVRNECAGAESEEQVLLDEAAGVQQQMDQVSHLMEQNKNRQQFKNIRQFVADYLQTACQTIQKQQPVIERVIQDLIQNQDELRSRANEGRDFIEQYFAGLCATVQANLTQRNEDYRLALLGYAAILSNVQNDVIGQARGTTASMLTSFHDVKDSMQNQRGAVNRHVDDSIAAVRTSNEMVNPSGHAGDTPVRRTEKYPRKITGGLRRELLEARMNGGADRRRTKESDKEN